MKHKFYDNWKDFWEFYMASVKYDIGKSKFEVLDYMQISKRLSPIPDDERKNIINPLIRKYGYITDSISLKYDPNAITFYSQYDKKRPRGKRVVIGYPTFTRYMVYWKPALEAAFRHELGHIVRKDIFLELGWRNVKNANTCMDIRINANLNRGALMDLYKCLYFKDNDVPLLVPEEQFPKIGLPYNEDNPIIPGWYPICEAYNRANEQAKGKQPPPQETRDHFNIGDIVIIDKKGSPDDGKPGRIIDIIGDKHVVVKATKAEVDAAMSGAELKMKTKDIKLGEFLEGELIPVQPPNEGGGDYGSEGEDGEPQQGGEPGEPQEGEEGETQSSIEKKEQILNDLKNSGIDGEPEEKPVAYDDEDLGEDQFVDDETSSDGEKGGEESDEKKGKKGEEITDSLEPKSEEEEELDRQIQEEGLKQKIEKSITNFSNLKQKYGDQLTDKEREYINTSINDLNELL